MDFPFYPTDIPSAAIEAVTFGLIFGLVIGLAIAFVFYIFNALGLYQISKRRGYKNAWLAFIPVVNSFVLGGIADNINACYMKKSNHRIWLIVLQLINCALYFAYIGVLFSFMVKVIQQAIYYGAQPQYSDVAPIMLMGLLMGLVSIALLVFTCICWYKIFADYSPNNATLFLILSILFGIAPFFIFAIRNKPSASLYHAAQRANPVPPQYQQPVAPPQEAAPNADVSNGENNEDIIL